MYLGLNEKAWAGLNIVIFGKTPILPMQLEQAIAQASPANEVRVDSFEDYDQAYDFCKAQKNVGLIFMLENSGEGLTADTFSQLATHYESKGWPCFGILLHEKEKSMMGYLSLKKNKNLIGYYPTQDLLDSEKTFNTLNEVWKSFVEAFESTIIPEKLQETLLAIAEPILHPDSYKFRNRLSVLLTRNLNISWLEAIALKWQPVVAALRQVSEKALEPNGALVQIADMATPSELVKDITIVAQQKIGLASRVATIINLLDEARLNHTLDQVLDNAKSKAIPGSPALIRQIASAKENIQTIAADYQTKRMSIVG